MVTEAQMKMQSYELQAEALSSEIQFGVELEFFAPPDPVWKSSSGKFHKFVQTLLDRDHVYHYLASALQKSGLQAAYIMETADSDCEENELRKGAPRGSIVKSTVSPDMRVMNPSSIRRGSGENPLFRYWLIKWESDLSGCGDHKGWEPVELNTPILREPEANNGFPSLKKAMDVLRTAHPDTINMNDSCGLHVHVSPVRGLSALHAKRVSTLVFLLEDNLLYHLCSPYRRQVNDKISSVSPLARPPARPLPPAAAVNLPENLMFDMGRAMNHLWEPDNLIDVGTKIYRDFKINDAKHTALCVNMHLHDDDTHTYTLEFRYAQAAFSEGSFTENWVSLVLTLCKVAFLPTERYKAAVARIWAILAAKPTPEASWAKLLRVLNDSAPGDWKAKSTEQYWRGQLASQGMR